MMPEFEVVGTVRGKGRPRFTRSMRVYADPKTAEFEKRVAAAFEEWCGGWKAEGPVAVRIDSFRPLPKSRPKRVNSEPDAFKPDADNIAKAVLDALNGIAYEDDAQVVDLRVVKHERERGATERLRIRIEEL